MSTTQEFDQDFSQHTGARMKRHTSKVAERSKTTADTDLSHSRAAYLGSWRQAYRQVKDVIANPDSGKAVLELKQGIERKWDLYVRAHKLLSERTILSDKKRAKFDKEFGEHVRDNEDALQTLENVLIRDIVERRNRSQCSSPAQARHTTHQEERRASEPRKQTLTLGAKPKSRSTPIDGLRATLSPMTKELSHASAKLKSGIREAWEKARGADDSPQRGMGASPLLTQLSTNNQQLRENDHRQPEEVQLIAQDNQFALDMDNETIFSFASAHRYRTPAGTPVGDPPVTPLMEPEGHTRAQQLASEARAPAIYEPRPEENRHSGYEPLSPDVRERSNETRRYTSQQQLNAGSQGVALSIGHHSPGLASGDESTDSEGDSSDSSDGYSILTTSSRREPRRGEQPSGWMVAPAQTQQSRLQLKTPLQKAGSRTSLANQDRGGQASLAPVATSQVVQVVSVGQGTTVATQAERRGPAVQGQIRPGLNVSAASYVPQQVPAQASLLSSQAPLQPVVGPSTNPSGISGQGLNLGGGQPMLNTSQAVGPGQAYTGSWGPVASSVPMLSTARPTMSTSTQQGQSVPGQAQLSYAGGLLTNNYLPQVAAPVLPSTQGSYASLSVQGLSLTSQASAGGFLNNDMLPVIQPVLPTATLGYGHEQSSQQGWGIPETSSADGTVPGQAVSVKANSTPGISDILALAHMNMHLPPPEIMTFDGQAKNWSAFVTNFNNNIANRVTDPALRLSYLIQHCSGEAKKCIQELVVLPADVGYATAVATLQKRFGSRHAVAKSYVDSVRSGAKILPNDVEGLLKFSSDLNMTYIVLSQLQYASDINSTDTMTQCVRRLPFNLGNEWVKQAARISLNQYREPNFYDFVKFVEASAEVANTYYGRENAKAQSKHYSSTQQPAKKQPQTNQGAQARPQTMVVQGDLSAPIVPVESSGGKKKKRKRKKKGTGQGEEQVVAAARAEAPAQATQSAPISQKACPSCDVDSHKLENCRKFKQLPIKERLDIVQRSQRCFRCLQTGHHAKECDKLCPQCQRRHHEALHDRGSGGQTVTSAATQVTRINSDAMVGTAEGEDWSVWLCIVPVIVHGKDHDVRTYAFIDSGSNSTLMTRGLFESLGVEGFPLDYSIRTLNSSEKQGAQYEGVVDVSSVDGKETVTMRIATVFWLPIPLNSERKSMDKWPHLQDIDIPTVGQGEIGMLIGMDCPELQWSFEEVRGGRGEPFARKTLFGWTIIGPTVKRPATLWGPEEPEKRHAVHTVLADPLRKQLERQWDHDFGDLERDEKESMSINDKEALKIREDTVVTVDGKYRLSIPWKIEPTTLPNNRRTAEVRLKHLKRKLEKDPKLLQQYTATVEKYVKDGHARQLKACEIQEDSAQWYLPHHPVFKRSNPAKCRVVFDCAAKYSGLSLNDAIHQGPNLMNSLAGVLLRFRRELVAIVGDIEAMFHQCRVTPKDQNFLRFLWWEDGDISKAPKVYCMTVHLFGATSSPSVAAFCMRKTAHDNVTEFDADVIETLKRSFYVDDMLQSTATAEQAEKLRRGITELLKRGGFRLTKFLSTSREVLQQIPEEDRAKSLQAIDLDDASLPQESALGLQWRVETDCFTYDAQLEEKPFTKRGLLSMTASLYDPLGYVGPVVLIPKLIQQELCRQQLDWDDDIPKDLVGGVEEWLKGLPMLKKIEIPRCIRPTGTSLEEGQVELHAFSDASEYAYGAVIYARYAVGNDVKVSLLMAKSRVAPLKLVSIPRLELTAALVSCKLHQFVVDELDLQIKASFFWTDSTTVLRYLESKSARYKTFVAHRVLEIQRMTEFRQWNYVNTKSNPADHASRGIRTSEENKLQAWLEGPKFLCDRIDDYRTVFDEPSEPSTELEVRVNLVGAETRSPSEYLLEYFSSYHRLCKAVAWMKKFVRFRRGQDVVKEIKVEDLVAAEESVLRCVQRQAYQAELGALVKGQQLSASSPLLSLDVFVDEHGLLRVGGRLKRCKANRVERHPIVLPKHVVTDLIVRQLHEENAHAGANHTLSLVRRKFFPVKGYQLVKSVLHRCVTCRRLRGKPMGQKMADLPPERIQLDQPPFASVGVDYFGPMSVKFRRGTAKRYGCLFTCLTTRAVHVEVTHSMTSDSFLMALQRFMARRGKPTSVFSDNGSNLVAADQELKAEVEAINDHRLNEELLLEGIEWHFIPPHAPHMGGVWERMVKSVKTVLRALVTHRLLSDEELLTFLAEAEKIVNDRPLTTVSSDHRDLTPLTPNDLLLLRRNSCEAQVAADNPLRTRWATVQALANAFYERFLKEYLPTLQARSKWETECKELRENDVVLVTDAGLPRGQWPLGLVVEALVSEDGRVRAANVKVGKKILRRPATQLVFLEHQD